jgi:hypothetical protein
VLDQAEVSRGVVKIVKGILFRIEISPAMVRVTVPTTVDVLKPAMHTPIGFDLVCDVRVTFDAQFGLEAFKWLVTSRALPFELCMGCEPIHLDALAFLIAQSTWTEGHSSIYP